MRSPRRVGLLLALLAAGCTTPSGSPVPNPPSSGSVASAATAVLSVGLSADPETGFVVPPALLRRLQPPQIPAGTCPTPPARMVDPAFGPAMGPGPVYPVGLAEGALAAVGPQSGSEFGGQYGGQKVLWIIDTAYPGPVLIRGGQLDGSNPVRFWRGPDPAPQMQLAPRTASDGWRDIASYTRVRATGCYFWQVDGTNFSYSIVFHVPNYAGYVGALRPLHAA